MAQLRLWRRLREEGRPLEEALRWRTKTRGEFEGAFARGYVVTGFEDSSYILVKR